MFHREHLPPHLHAQFGEYEITIDIETRRHYGKFPAHAHRRILEWVGLHQAELLECWRLAREGKLIPRVAPLE